MSAPAATFTPGPWRSVAWNNHAATTIVADNGPIRVVIAECSGNGQYCDDRLADAQLIAAAPDLLRALRLLLDRSALEYWPVEQEVARAAIKKALLQTEAAV